MRSGSWVLGAQLVVGRDTVCHAQINYLLSEGGAGTLMLRSVHRDDLHPSELAGRRVHNVFGPKISCVVVWYTDRSRHRIDFHSLTAQRSLVVEQIFFDSPEEPIRIAEDDLRQRLSGVFSEIHYRPGHSLLTRRTKMSCKGIGASCLNVLIKRTSSRLKESVVVGVGVTVSHS
jgi:hypothetical protein